MASGHVNRIYRPNTRLHRPTLRREESPCQLGAVHTRGKPEHICSVRDFQVLAQKDLPRYLLFGHFRSGTADDAFRRAINSAEPDRPPHRLSFVDNKLI